MRQAKPFAQDLAAIAAVVVLPFVAEITAEPSGSLAARRSIAPGSSFQSSFPGTVVPPPAPARRDRLPAARATAISAASGIGKRKTGGRLSECPPIPRMGELRGPYRKRVRYATQRPPTLRPGSSTAALRGERCGAEVNDGVVRVQAHSGVAGSVGRVRARTRSGEMVSGARHFSRHSFSRSSCRWGHLRSPARRSLRPSSRPAFFPSAQSGPADKFSVIVQGKGGNQAAHAVADVLGVSLKDARTFSSIDGVAVDLTGAQILALAADKHVTAITADSLVRLSATAPKWPFVTGVNKYWATTYSSAAPASTIAIVDSGIDASRPEFAGRVVANVNLSSLSGNSAGDGRGHGTFVAGIAASSLAGKSGAAQRAKIVSLDVMDDKGMARTSDVIAAADWILANKCEVRDPRRELLAPFIRCQQLHVRPARQGGREALVQQRRGRGGRRQLRQARRTERRSVRTRQRPVRDHRRRERHGDVRVDVRRRRGALVGLRLHA